VTGRPDRTGDAPIEGLLRELAPQVLGALIRRYGTFDMAEDAVQEALLAAAVQWPAEGVPDNPRGWLLTVASRRLTDQLRSDVARHRRETAVAALLPPEALVVPAPTPPTETDAAAADDTLLLLFLCCHPALSPPSQLALTLRAVGGLTTEQVARAFFVPDATMGQRISRAKQAIRDAGARFELPPPEGALASTVVEHARHDRRQRAAEDRAGDHVERVVDPGVHARVPDDGGRRVHRDPGGGPGVRDPRGERGR